MDERHRPVYALVRVGWEQECVVCGQTFRSKKPSQYHEEACKQRAKRARARARERRSTG